MGDLTAFRGAIAAAIATDDMIASERPAAACHACIGALPFDGGAFTVMASDSVRQTLAASDEIIAAVEESQFLLGEGPSLQAFATGRPVLVSDVAAGAAARWPVFVDSLDALPVGGLYTLPMHLGAITVGVCVLYRREPGSLSPADLAFTLAAIDITTLALLALRAGDPVEHAGGSPRAGEGSALPEARWGDPEGADRLQVHQATGMLIAQLEVTAEEAFARLRAYAFAHNRRMDDVAEDIVGLRLRLQDDPA